MINENRNVKWRIFKIILLKMKEKILYEYKIDIEVIHNLKSFKLLNLLKLITLSIIVILYFKY